MITHCKAALAAAGLLVAACGGATDDSGSADTQPAATDPPASEPATTEPPATEPPVTQPPATEPPATQPVVTEPPATTTPPSRTFRDIGHPVAAVVPAGDVYWAIGSLTKLDVLTGEILAELDWRSEFEAACGCAIEGRLGSQVAAPEAAGGEPSVLYLLVSTDQGDRLVRIQPDREDGPVLTQTPTTAPDGGMVLDGEHIVIAGMQQGDDGSKTIVVERFPVGDLAAGDDATGSVSTTGGFGAGATLSQLPDGTTVVLEGKTTTRHVVGDDGSLTTLSGPDGETSGTTLFSSELAGARSSTWLDGPGGLLVIAADGTETTFPALKSVGAATFVAFSGAGAHVQHTVWDFDADPPEPTYFYTFVPTGAAPGSVTPIEIPDGGLPVPLADGTVYVGSSCFSSGAGEPTSIGNGIDLGFPSDDGTHAVVLGSNGVRHVTGCPAEIVEDD